MRTKRKLNIILGVGEQDYIQGASSKVNIIQNKNVWHTISGKSTTPRHNAALTA